MYSVEEIKMDIGEAIELYTYNEKTGELEEISEEEFMKLKPAKQIESLLDAIRLLHNNLKEDLRSIWERINKLEE